MSTKLQVMLPVLALLVAGCLNTPPNLSDAEKRRAVLNWLDCEECYNNQYEYLVSLGPQVRPLLEEVIEDEGFADVIAARRQAYAQRVTPIVAAELGVDDTSSASEDERARIESRVEELVNIYISGDKKRHVSRATRALDNLSGRRPSDPEER